MIIMIMEMIWEPEKISKRYFSFVRINSIAKRSTPARIKYKKNNKKEAKRIKQRHILNKQTPKIKEQDFGTRIADLQV